MTEEGSPDDLTAPLAALEGQPLPIVEIASPWFRCSRVGRGVIHFGRAARGRFDDPTRRFGVLYVGISPHAAFIETIDPRPVIFPEELVSRVMSSLVAARSARVVDLTGQRLAGLGLDARIFAGNRSIARAWSRAFHEHPDRPDGLLYRSRRDPSQLALALYERDGWALDVTTLPQSALLALADHCGLAIG